MPDFLGFREDALRVVLEAAPDVFNHNIETTERLYARVRPKGDYRLALDLLDRAKDVWADVHPDREPLTTKSGMIVGMGETDEEVVEVMRDLRAHRVDVVTIGQYLQPTARHLQLDRWVTPEQFREYRLTRAARWASAPCSRARWCARATAPRSSRPRSTPASCRSPEPA